jgi:hypothetical protein
MNFVVTNFSGNVGKSTISKHLLGPRLPDSEVTLVESINANDSDSDAIRGKDYGALVNSLVEKTHYVIDVGASNVEDFIARMKQYKGSHEEFDLFLIPTVPTHKQQEDTISTIDALSKLGVPGDKIRVVFNRIEPEVNLQKEFALLFDLHSMRPNSFVLYPLVSIQENELYGLLEGRSIADILEDPTDFNAKIKQSNDKFEKLEWSKKKGVKRLASGVNEELDAVFALLFPEGV